MQHVPFKDPEKQKEYRKKHYDLNREKSIKASMDFINNRRKENREYTNLIKSSSPCTDCQIKYPPYVMQFDHLDAKAKVDSVANLVGAGVSLQKIKDEIAKCELVCSNCHWIRTHNRRNSIAD